MSLARRESAASSSGAGATVQGKGHGAAGPGLLIAVIVVSSFVVAIVRPVADGFERRARCAVSHAQDVGDGGVDIPCRSDQPVGVVVTPDGTTLYVVANKSHTVQIIDVASGEVVDCVDPTQGGTVEAVAEEVAVSPDGDWVVVTNPVWTQEFTGSATIIDTSDRSIDSTLEFPNSSATCPRAAPDGDTVYIGGTWPSRIYVVDVDSAAVTHTIPLGSGDHELWTFVFALSPAGETLYAIGPYGAPGSCRLVEIDAATRSVTDVHVVPIPDVINLGYAIVSPDGSELWVQQGEAQKLHVIELADPEAAPTTIDFVDETFLIHMIEFSLDGSVAYVGADTPGGVYVVDTATRTISERVEESPGNEHVGDMHALDLSPDGETLYVVGCTANGVFYLDTGTNEMTRFVNLNPIETWPLCLELNPDASRLYVAGIEMATDGVGRIYEVDTSLLEVVRRIPVETALAEPGRSTDFADFALSPDGLLLYTGICAHSAADPGHMLSLVVDLAAEAVVASIDLGEVVADVGDKVSVTPSGDHVLYTVTTDATMLVASTDTHEVVETVALGIVPQDLEIAPDGARAYVSGFVPYVPEVNAMVVVDLETVSVVETVLGTTEFPCPGLAVSPDEAEAWLGGACRIEIVDMGAGTVVDDIDLCALLTAGDTGAACPFGITWFEGRVHVANFDSNTYMLFDAASRTLLHKVRVGFQPLDVVVAPDGDTAYVVDSDSQSVSVVDTASGSLVRTIDLGELGPAASAASFRVTAGGAFLSDGTVRADRFQTGGADIAEWVDVSEPVNVGDVLVLDPESPGRYRRSHVACASRVAGVVSAQPGMILGSSGAGQGAALLALAGMVPVKVTDEGGPIALGDLLITSSTPGCAMRCAGDPGCDCAMVGKAMEGMVDSEGIIVVLLMAH